MVELPNTYQVTPLMILAAWGTPTTRPAAATKRRRGRRSAQNPAPSGRRHPAASCQGPDHSPPRSGAGTRPFASWRKMTSTLNRAITVAERRWTRPVPTTVTRRFLGEPGVPARESGNDENAQAPDRCQWAGQRIHPRSTTPPRRVFYRAARTNLSARERMCSISSGGFLTSNSKPISAK